MTLGIIGGQDYYDTHDESYLCQFEGFMEDYEAVSAALPPPLQCDFFIAFHYYTISLNFNISPPLP